MRCISSAADLEEAISVLVKIEPRFGAVVERHGIPPLRLVPQGLQSLLRIVTDQLISLQAGAAIWRRVEERLSPFDPDLILSHSEEDLKCLGLSGAKARTFHAAAAAARQALFDPRRTVELDDDALAKALMAIHGIGPWTADIYSLAAVGRIDSWPRGDLALQVAAQDLLDLGARPKLKTMSEIAEKWRPYRSVAARLLWSHYRGLKGIGQAII
jgi:DNA-3-methyladenine glycosylase II